MARPARHYARKVQNQKLKSPKVMRLENGQETLMGRTALSESLSKQMDWDQRTIMTPLWSIDRTQEMGTSDRPWVHKTNSASSKPIRICTAPFEQVKRRSFSGRVYKFGCVCSYMAGLTLAWGYKFGCVWSVSFSPSQTGLCKIGWVWSSLTNSPSHDQGIRDSDARTESS